MLVGCRKRFTRKTLKTCESSFRLFFVSFSFVLQENEKHKMKDNNCEKLQTQEQKTSNLSSNLFLGIRCQVSIKATKKRRQALRSGATSAHNCTFRIIAGNDKSGTISPWTLTPCLPRRSVSTKQPNNYIIFTSDQAMAHVPHEFICMCIHIYFHIPSISFSHLKCWKEH